VCPRFYPQPVAAAGYYPRSAQEFIPCVPASACPGLNAALLGNASFSLSPFYDGDTMYLIGNDSTLSSATFTNWTRVNAALNVSLPLCAPGQCGLSCHSAVDHTCGLLLPAVLIHRFSLACYPCYPSVIASDVVCLKQVILNWVAAVLGTFVPAAPVCLLSCNCCL
jgi:hypothetical protein